MDVLERAEKLGLAPWQRDMNALVQRSSDFRTTKGEKRTHELNYFLDFVEDPSVAVAPAWVAPIGIVFRSSKNDSERLSLVSMIYVGVAQARFDALRAGASPDDLEAVLKIPQAADKWSGGEISKWIEEARAKDPMFKEAVGKRIATQGGDILMGRRKGRTDPVWVLSYAQAPNAPLEKKEWTKAARDEVASMARRFGHDPDKGKEPPARK
jgi:hypothetical protein